MENQEVLKAIATLADKVSRYHERLLAVERENEKITKRNIRTSEMCLIYIQFKVNLITPMQRLW